MVNLLANIQSQLKNDSMHMAPSLAQISTFLFFTAALLECVTQVVMADYSLPDGLSPEVQDLIAAMLK